MTGADRVGRRVGGVVLAAGRGARFTTSGGQGPKLLAPVRGRPLLAWALAALEDSGLPHRAAVVGPGAGAGLVPTGTDTIENPDPDRGLAWSLQLALDWARRRGLTHLIVGLGDQPGVLGEAYRRVAEAPASPMAVATYPERGHPVRLGREVWAMLPERGDEGARGLMARHPNWVLEVPCPGRPEDVDRAGDLGTW